jgi:hypothetical protein
MASLKNTKPLSNAKSNTVTLPKGTKSHRELSGPPEADFTHVLVLQTVQTFWVSPFGEEEKGRHYQAGLAALRGFKPRDELEGMLAAQMIGLHNAAMECMRRAMVADQPMECQNHLLAQANKLTRSYTLMMESLNRYRGKATEQKVTVEHVHVHAGGQAIVGHVETKNPKS